MGTKLCIYADGQAGFEAMSADFSSLFAWDEVVATDAGKKEFRKHCGNGTYVGLRVANGGDTCSPDISAISYNGVTKLYSRVSYKSGNTSRYTRHIGYAFGDGFFAMSGGPSRLPYTAYDGFCAGLSTATNILTGESSYCSFGGAVESTSNFYYLTATSDAYNIFSRQKITGALIGSAVSLHCTALYEVSDKALWLNSIPDTFESCCSSVVFNGRPYIRLGRLLVPTG